MLLVREILRQFYVESLEFCPPHLSAVSTFPWEIQESHFNNTKNRLKYVNF